MSKERVKTTYKSIVTPYDTFVFIILHFSFEL